MMAIIAIAQLVTMVVTTLLFIDSGELAPAIGHLCSGVVGVVMVATPILLASRGRLGWFSGAPEAAGAPENAVLTRAR